MHGDLPVELKREAGTALPLYQPAGCLGKVPVAHGERKRPLPAKDALPRWHDPRHLTPGNQVLGMAGITAHPSRSALASASAGDMIGVPD
mgnify:CR=1 FL=1